MTACPYPSIMSLVRPAEIDPYNHSTPTSTKLPILDTRKFEQWKFRIQQYLQHEHHALWEVIEFGDSYKAPPEETGKGVTGEGSTKKKGRTVAITVEDMQKRRNDVKARTTLLLALPDEHQLRFIKYDNAKELWEAILKTFSGNEATKKTKKNQLKQQYGNFKAEGLETLEQTFNSLSNDTVYAFIATQPNGSQIKYEDITQIDDDDIEEMDIKWDMALLSMRADRFWKKTGKKITIHGSDVAGFDKSKVECFNFHKMGHFARECRSPRSQDRGKKESYKKDPKVEELAPKAMIAIDGIGWDWSCMAEEDENHALMANEMEVPIEYALMAKSSSSLDNHVYDDSFCSKSCRKNTKNLNNKIIKLNEELSDCETDLYNYKRGLSQVEARLVEFKKNEIKLCERIRVLKRDLELRDNKIENLRNELEEIRRVWDLMSISVVPPPPVQVYSPPKKDLSWMGLPEFVDETVTDYSRSTPSVDVSKDFGFPTTRRAKFPLHCCSKVPTAKPRVDAVKGNRGKAVKASACWIWKPKQNQLDQSLNLNGVSGIPQDNIDVGRVETMDGETKIIANFNDKQRTVTESSIRRHLKLLNDEGSENPTKPHHTPSAQYESTPQEDQTTSPEPIPQATTLPSQSHPDISIPRRLTRGAIPIYQYKAPTPGVDETASPTRDDRYEEAFPTATSLDAGQDRENIANTSTMPHEASPGVTSLGGGEGSMQQKLQELMDMCTNLQQQHFLMEQRIQSQDLEITQLKNKVKTLEDNEKRRSTGKGSDNTDEAANVLSTLEAANVLSSRSFPTAAPTGVATASGSFPTTVIFTTASVTTPYTRRKRSSRGIIIEPSHTTSVLTISAKGKGKEKMVESIGTKKKKIPEQLDAQVAKELEMEFSREE
ncbi:ribonuclease H-like domain-containing protein [Tanacetum coccineum]